jgi:hypothetical protein
MSQIPNNELSTLDTLLSTPLNTLPGVAPLADGGLKEHLVVDEAKVVMELGDGAGEDPLVGLGSGGQSRPAQSTHQGGGRPLLLHVGAGPPLLPPRRWVCDPSHTCTQFITYDIVARAENPGRFPGEICQPAQW